jgi:hypothetical protein
MSLVTYATPLTPARKLLVPLCNVCDRGHIYVNWVLVVFLCLVY